jgi:hypothetical protein
MRSSRDEVCMRSFVWEVQRIISSGGCWLNTCNSLVDG